MAKSTETVLSPKKVLVLEDPRVEDQLTSARPQSLKLSADAVW